MFRPIEYDGGPKRVAVMPMGGKAEIIDWTSNEYVILSELMVLGPEHMIIGFDKQRPLRFGFFRVRKKN